MKKVTLSFLALAVAIIVWFTLGPAGDRSFRVASKQDQVGEFASPVGKPDGAPQQSSKDEQAGDASGFTLPQIGRVAMPSQTEKLAWKTPAKNVPIQLRIFRDANGKFVRAEYKNTSKEKIRLDAVERGLEASSERIYGLAQKSTQNRIAETARYVDSKRAFRASYWNEHHLCGLLLSARDGPCARSKRPIHPQRVWFGSFRPRTHGRKLQMRSISCRIGWNAISWR